MDTRVCKVCGASELDARWVTHKGVNNGRLCLTCKIAANKKYILENNEAYRAANRLSSKRYHKNRRETDQTWAEKRALVNLERSRQRYATDQDYRLKEIKRGLRKAKDNPAMYNRATSKRRARLLKAMPIWLSKDQLAQINELYTACAKLSALGDPHHVDHIVPLQGKLVCGLHVPWNLQILKASENISKGNRYADLETT